MEKYSQEWEEALKKKFTLVDGVLHRVNSTTGEIENIDHLKPNSHGYVKIVFKRKQLAVHRVAFFLENGYWPEVVDHIDGNRSNNHISNLRESTIDRNTKNIKGSANKSDMDIINKKIRVHCDGWIDIEIKGRSIVLTLPYG